MRIEAADSDIGRIGLAAQGAFSIRATGKAFRILSSSLYRDKIAAIVRELSCNAADSHTAEGQSGPFLVSLPNAINAAFSVRDYGTGLSHKDVMGLYTTYFDSTKARSNEQIGALGLGSKSPFSYTDSFAVSAYDGRWRRDYCAYLTEDGTPSIALLTRQRDSEPRGIKVSVPVPALSDHDAFAARAAVLLARFRPRPLVTGRAVFEFADAPTILEGDGWRIVESTKARADLGVGGVPLALMGPVAYPISVGSFAPPEPAKLAAAIPGLEIDFPMGALDVTAGREDLSYDKRTIAAVIEALHRVHDGMGAAAQRALDGCATEYAARRLFGRLMNIPGRRDRLRFRGDVLYSDSFSCVFKADHPGVVVRSVGVRGGRIKVLASHHGDHHSAEFHIPATRGRVFENDLSRGGMRRVLHHRLVLEDNAVMLAVEGPPAARRKFLDRLDGFPITRTSMLAAPPSVAKGNGSKVGFLRLRLSPLTIRRDDWTRVHHDVPAQGNSVPPPPPGVLLVPMRNCGFLSPSGARLKSAFAYSVLRDAGVLPEEVWGVVESQAKRLDAAGWDMLHHVAPDRARKLIADPVLAGRLWQCLQRTAERSNAWRFGSFAKSTVSAVAGLLPLGHPVREAEEAVRRVNAAGGGEIDHESSNLLRALRELQIPLPQMQDGEERDLENLSHTARQRCKAVLDTYPLFATVARDTSVSPQHIAEYILLVDAARESAAKAAPALASAA